MLAEARFSNCQIISDIFINKDENNRTSMSFFVQYYNIFKRKDTKLKYLYHTVPVLTFNLEIIKQYKNVLKKGMRVNILAEIYTEEVDDGIKKTSFKIQNTIGSLQICGDDKYDVLKMIQENE